MHLKYSFLKQQVKQCASVVVAGRVWKFHEGTLATPHFNNAERVPMVLHENLRQFEWSQNGTEIKPKTIE